LTVRLGWRTGGCASLGRCDPSGGWKETGKCYTIANIKQRQFVVVVEVAEASTSSAATAAWFVDWITNDTASSDGTHVSIAFDPGNSTPYISYYDATNGNLMLASPVSWGGSCGSNNSWGAELWSPAAMSVNIAPSAARKECKRNIDNPRVHQ